MPALGVGAADAVVDDLDHELVAVAASTSTVAALALGVLADVGEALADDVVGGDLDRLGRAGSSSSTSSRTGTGARGGQRLERDRRARGR